MKLPDTDSIRELAKFWNTHDLSEFQNELEEVTKPVFEPPTANWVTVPLSADQRKAIRAMATSRGVGEAALIREWVQEKLHQ